MTYIKWKDEVESYLGNLSASEKQKVFSYFAEMYADKRDAGISEEKIIEGFGAPYDVAQRILADSKENASSQQTENGSGAVNGSGGNNYNYNYYNYNYGGAPSAFGNPPSDGGRQVTPDGGRQVTPDGGRRIEREYIEVKREDVDVSDIDMPLPEGTPKPKKKKSDGEKIALTVVLVILLTIPSIVLLSTAVGLTIGFFAAAIGCIISGFVTIGGAIGGLASGMGISEIGLMGSGFIEVGIGMIFLPLAMLIAKLIWKFIAWVFGQFKSLVKA